MIYDYDTGFRGVTMDVTLTAAPDDDSDPGYDGPASDKDGGGCDAGFAGIAGLAVLVGLIAATRGKSERSRS